MNSQTLNDLLFFETGGLAGDFAAPARMGIYVHVPFCPHICPYCDFVKTSRFSRKDVAAYFSGLEKQFDSFAMLVPQDISDVTLYFGGGTPSLFPAGYFSAIVEKISSRFRIGEFTVETNPFSNSEKIFREWQMLGVNRVTLGVQSLEPAVLGYLGRKHTPEDVLKNLDAVRGAGIEQVQTDLIFGVKNLPEQRTITNEIVRMERGGATGVSCYLLTIEESTPFVHEFNSSDETIESEYQEILSACAALGFEQYETSNFSRHAPVHNRLYWYGLPYLGLGTGAHGLLPATENHPFGRRYKVGPPVLKRTAGDDELPFSTAAESLFSIDFYEGNRTREMAIQELLLTLLRTREGLPLRWLKAVFEDAVLGRFWNDSRVRRALDSGQFELSTTHLKLSAHERLRGDAWSLLVASLLCP